MTRTIKLPHGEATLKAVVNHATKSAHEAALFKGLSLTMKPGASKAEQEKALETLEIPFENMINSSEVLVLGLLKSLTIDGKELDINKEALDEIPSEDYEVLKNEANAILTPAGKDAAMEKKSKS